MEQYLLTLYITGPTPRSQRAIVNLRKICARLGEHCTMQVIDVLEDPRLAEEAQILATPTVIREQPAPVRRIIGDLSDVDKVMLGLDLQPRHPDTR